MSGVREGLSGQSSLQRVRMHAERFGERHAPDAAQDEAGENRVERAVELLT
ncbi:hypothetical protein I549_0221 [Mycobacterium avium subsp. avium 2285 (R)]|nr:hypothetical protein I549_0221 [Mycobacterium avium subsp. avium 2285 (R)]